MLEFLTPMELSKLSEKERKDYDKQYTKMRRSMRALVASQDSSYKSATIKNGKTTINSIARHYNLDDSSNMVNAKIMEVFVGDGLFPSIRELYNAKYEYDNAPKERRKKMTDPKSPIDYFDLPTLFHFYNFRKTLITLEKQEIKEKKKRSFQPYEFDNLLKKAKENYTSKENKENLFFNPKKDIRILRNPLRSYTSISEQQRKLDSKIEPNLLDFSSREPIQWQIKKSVLDFMFSYVEKTKPVSKEEIEERKEYYAAKSRCIIKNKQFVEPFRKQLLDKYGSVSTTFYSPKEMEDEKEGYSVLLSFDEYPLFKKEGRYYYCNDPDSEYHGNVFNDMGDCVEEYEEEKNDNAFEKE